MAGYPAGPMLPPRIALIVAMDENRLIGREGDLPWRLPNDLAHFKRLTMGHPILMGRKTWESLGRPLPGRRNIVLTRDTAYVAEGGEVLHSLDEALRAAQDSEMIFVIGGAEIYAMAMGQADRLYVTHVKAQLEGDTWFPEMDPAQWVEMEREEHAADTRNEHDHDFVIYDRRKV